MTPVHTPITADEHEKMIEIVARLEQRERDAAWAFDVASIRERLVSARPRLAASCFVPLAGGALGHEPAPDSIEVARVKDDGSRVIVCELHELSTLLRLGNTYTVTLGHMSRAAFDNLPEFQG